MQLLPNILKSIKDSADECTQLAGGVRDKFAFVMSLTAELLELCTLTKGTKEQQIRDAQAKQAANKILKVILLLVLLCQLY